MITTTMMTSVVRIVSSRVGQTTLRSSNCDSTRYSRIERPARVKAPTATQRSEAGDQHAEARDAATSRRTSSRRTTPATSSSTASADMTMSTALLRACLFDLCVHVMRLSDARRRRPAVALLMLSTIAIADRSMIWHARRDSNPQPAVLETAALPIELLAYGSVLARAAC